MHEAGDGMLTIAGLWVYPVKSLGGVAVERAAILPEGSLQGDREWLVVDEAGAMLWQGDLPRMALLRVEYAPDRLAMRRPDGAAVEMDPRHGGEACVVTQYRNGFDGVDAGAEAAAFLSAWLDRPARLVRIGGQAHRWPKVNPLHVLSDRSLEALNARLGAADEAALPTARFRPNVLLAGADRPFIEETMAVIDFGEARIRLREPATRCELVNISLVDASRERQPLPLIARMSRERPSARKGSFGVYSQAEGTELVRGMTAPAP